MKYKVLKSFKLRPLNKGGNRGMGSVLILSCEYMELGCIDAQNVSLRFRDGRLFLEYGRPRRHRLLLRNHAVGVRENLPLSVFAGRQQRRSLCESAGQRRGRRCQENGSVEKSRQERRQDGSNRCRREEKNRRSSGNAT